MSSDFVSGPGKKYFQLLWSQGPSRIRCLPLPTCLVLPWTGRLAMAKGRRDRASTERRPPRSQSWRHPVAHSSRAAGCSFLAWMLEGGQGAVRLHGSLGTEPRPLSGHESGPWHQECGSSPLIWNCLSRDHSCSGGSHFLCSLGARQGQEQRWSWNEWQES